MIDTIIVVFCPPLSLYKEQPEDQSKCRLEDCPHCNEKMWLSEKKEYILNKNKLKEDPLEEVLACYICFEKMVRSNPEYWKNHIRVDI